MCVLSSPTKATILMSHLVRTGIYWHLWEMERTLAVGIRGQLCFCNGPRDPTTWQPWFNLPHGFSTVSSQAKVSAKPTTWSLATSDYRYCGCGQTAVDSCPLTKFAGGLQLLHYADKESTQLRVQRSRTEINMMIESHNNFSMGSPIFRLCSRNVELQSRLLCTVLVAELVLSFVDVTQGAVWFNIGVCWSVRTRSGDCWTGDERSDFKLRLSRIQNRVVKTACFFYNRLTVAKKTG